MAAVYLFEHLFWDRSFGKLILDIYYPQHEIQIIAKMYLGEEETYLVSLCVCACHKSLCHKLVGGLI